MKSFITSLKFIALGVVVAIGASYVDAQTWNNAPTPAPTNNTSLPVDVSTTDQVKDGDLSVNAFIANQNAQFDQTIYLEGSVHGGTAAQVSSDSTVRFGGTDPINATITRIVNLVITKGLKTTNTIQSDKLAGASVGNLCVTSAGVLVRCTDPASQLAISNLEVYGWGNGNVGQGDYWTFQCIVSLNQASTYDVPVTVEYVWGDSGQTGTRTCSFTIPTGNLTWGEYQNIPGNGQGETPSVLDACVSSPGVPSIPAQWQC